MTAYPIDLRLSNRPIRAAFIVPTEESEKTHLILDATFQECYSRWCGAHTLIIPWDGIGTLPESYFAWLALCDPDWIYSYVDMSPSEVVRLNKRVCPMVFTRHNEGPIRAPPRWTDFQPRWGILEKALSSETLMYSISGRNHTGIPHILTAYGDPSDNRLAFDNFGPIHLSGSMPGVYTACCLCPETLPANYRVGTERVHDAAAVITRVHAESIITGAQLASVEQIGFPGMRDLDHLGKIYITIGNSAADRVSAWNRRLLTESYLGPYASLRMSLDDLLDEKLMAALARLIVFSMDGSERHVVTLTSSTHSESDVRQRLGAHQDKVAKSFARRLRWNDSHAIPGEESIADALSLKREPTSYAVILHKPAQAIEIKRPDHIARLPPRYAGQDHGSWMVTTFVGRSEQERKADNIDPYWVFPRRNAIGRAITTRPSRVSRNGHLEVIATHDHAGSRSDSEPTRTMSVRSPDHEELLSYAIASHGLRNEDLDSDYAANAYRYRGIRLSDKGQNLRGVISMFGALSDAGTFVSNRHWRDLLRRSRNKEGELKFQKHSDFLKIEGGKVLYDQIEKSHNIAFAEAKELIKLRVFDAVEAFLHSSVLHRGHAWRCSHCGNFSVTGLGHLTERMQCSICSTPYPAPLELNMVYSWNNFLYTSLVSSSGLPVLWALHQANAKSGDCFAFLPEVDIDWRDGSPPNEIDYIAIIDGSLEICEAKASMAVFLTQDPDGHKFAKIVAGLQPDLAILAFETVDPGMNDQERLRKELRQVVKRVQHLTGIPIEILIAEDDAAFHNVPSSFGVFGEREMGLRRQIRRDRNSKKEAPASGTVNQKNSKRSRPTFDLSVNRSQLCATLTRHLASRTAVEYEEHGPRSEP